MQLSLFTVEQWKPISHHPTYQISNLGNVLKPDGVLAVINTGKTYPAVTIQNKRHLVHRLVAQAFIPNPYNKPEVNHIDGDTQNYAAHNLEWVTRSENMKAGRRRYTKPQRHKQPFIPLEGEHLAQHPEYTDLLVSTLGRVVVSERQVWDGVKFVTDKTPMLLVDHSVHGYKYVLHRVNGKKYKALKIHRLVAQTFLPNINNKSSVNHINGKRDDNRLVNLEWATLSENNLHAIRTGLVQTPAWYKQQERLSVYAQRALDIWNDALTSTYTKKELQVKYKVSEYAFSKIFNRTSWGKLTSNLPMPVFKPEKRMSVFRQHTITYHYVDSLDGEIWKRVLGYKYRYYISNLGRLKRVQVSRPSRTAFVVSERIIAGRKDKLGRWRLEPILNDNKHNQVFAHVLVAQAFLPNPDNCRYVKAIDGDRSNCRVDNLRWTDKTNEPYLPMDVVEKVGWCQRSGYLISETMAACNVTRREYARFLKYFNQQHPELPKKRTKRAGEEG